MLNANDLLKEAIEQVRSLGIVPGLINPSVSINTRALKRFGACKKTPGIYDFEIQLNHLLLEVEKEKAMNTMVHEVLHTCKGCMNHGSLWSAYAYRMNNKFGYDISRTTTYEKAGIEKPKPNYIIECESCGNQFHRQKRSSLVKNVDRYRCSCGSKLKML